MARLQAMAQEQELAQGRLEWALRGLALQLAALTHLWVAAFRRHLLQARTWFLRLERSRHFALTDQSPGQLVALQLQ